MNVGVVSSTTNLWPKMRWVADAFGRLGHDVRHIHNRDHLIEQDPECDLIVFQHKSVIRWPNLRDIAVNKKAFWVQWWFDLISTDYVTNSGRSRLLRDQPLFQQFEPIMAAMDIVFIKERDLLGQFSDMGIRAFYLDQGCPSDITPVTYGKPRAWDVLLWGQSGRDYKRRTNDVCELSQSGLNVSWAIDSGSVPCRRLPWCHPNELHFLASNAKCVLSVDRRRDLDGYWSDRFWLAAGMGCVVLHRQGVGLPTGPYYRYTNIADAKRYIQNLTPSIMERIGKEMRKWVMSKHTYKHRIETMLKHIEKVAGGVIGQDLSAC